ncbi:GNAT family N-acetyltransferase [Enterococcus viikkiensis]|uniref:GNAT family N-acetyltransferase n=1 Tax=Enterococcus viikkiensis TaxID=930854 RepID=UPI0010F46455|nr:GNAT family N-acetyltransferase [Enterococcus viikkiensis]
MIKKIFYNSSIVSNRIIRQFNCGNPRLNIFFIDEAAESERCGIGNTTFFYDDVDERVIGYFTVSFRRINIKEYSGYPSFERVFINDFINTLKVEQFPVFEIMRFAVDVDYQNKNVGTSMMLEIYKDIMDFRLKYNLPVNNIFIESLYDATEFYVNLGFEFMKNSDNQEMLESYPMMINLEKISSILYA